MRPFSKMTSEPTTADKARKLFQKYDESAAKIKREKEYRKRLAKDVDDVLYGIENYAKGGLRMIKFTPYHSLSSDVANELRSRGFEVHEDEQSMYGRIEVKW